MARRRRSRIGLLGSLLMVVGFVPLLGFAAAAAGGLVVGVVVVAAAVLAAFLDPTWAWVPALAWLPWYAVFFVQRLGHVAPGLTDWPVAWGWFFGSVGAGGVVGASLALGRAPKAAPLALAIVACVALCASLFLPVLKGPDSAGLSAFESAEWATRVVFVLVVVTMNVWLFAEPPSAGMAALALLGMVAVMLLAFLPAERGETALAPSGWISAFTGGMLAFAVGLMARLAPGGA